MRLTRRSFLFGAAAGAGFAAPRRATNLVLILTDNQSARTLGCYGNPDVRTPNIDRLAREGMLFTRAFACNPVCSPTRASLLTGLMPSQHGVHRYLAAGGAQIGPGAYDTIREFPTLPKILTKAGYTAGLSGKWHLGDNLHPQEGFTYWVTKPHGHSEGFYGQEVIEDAKVRIEPSYLTDFWTGHGIRFLEQNRDSPFFLYLAYNGPYGLAGALKEPIRNRHAAYYADKEIPSFPRDTIHPWQSNNREFMDSVSARRKYAAEISGVDDGVGRIMETLTRLGVADNTLVVFMADQGLATGQSGFWGMGDHTRPLTAFDSMLSIPMIFWQPGRIKPGRTDLMVSTYDVLPTVLDYLGQAKAAPADPPPPGKSFGPALEGRSVTWENAVYAEFENVRAIRTDRFKYIERIHQAPNELYDLESDPGERLNLYGRPEHKDTTSSLQARLHAFFNRYADPKWDLWRGGRSKSNLGAPELFGLKNPMEPASPKPATGVRR